MHAAMGQLIREGAICESDIARAANGLLGRAGGPARGLGREEDRANQPALKRKTR